MACIPNCTYFLNKLKYYTLGSKDYSKRVYWAALPVNAAVNLAEVRGTVSPLAVSKSKASVDSMNEPVKTIPI